MEKGEEFPGDEANRDENVGEEQTNMLSPEFSFLFFFADMPIGSMSSSISVSSWSVLEACCS